MATINSKIGFIGCGNMGEALIKGLLDKRIVSNGKILASDARPARRRYIQKRYKIKVVSSNKVIVKESDIIILAVKPQNIGEVLSGICNDVTADKLIISIAAGIKIKHIQQNLRDVRVIRVMPNTPALIGAGITAICRSKSAGERDYNLAKKIFGAVGSVIEVNENLMDVITATSGSGPAYFFLLIDAMVKAARSSGLSQKVSEQLVLNTAYGASLLALKSRKPMAQLIKKVASKGGTTEAALKVFNKRRFQNIVKEAIDAAAKRSRELSK